MSGIPKDICGMCYHPKTEAATCNREDCDLSSASPCSDPIVQVSGFGVENTYTTQCNYLLVGLTKSGKVVLSRGDGIWSDVSPNPDKNMGNI